MRNKNKQSLVYLLSFVLFISLFYFYRFWVTSSELEDPSPNQSLFSESEKSSEKSDPMNRHENSQEKENKKTRSLIQTSTSPVFETFDLIPEKVELFHGRRSEPGKATLAISGLKIDGKAFKAENKKDLPLTLTVPLPGGEGKREFVHSFVDFQNRDSFVWVGTGKENTSDSFHLSFYQGAIVGSIETSKGSYEIKQLTESKNIIRKLNMNQFPSLQDDIIPPPPEENKTNTEQETSSSRKKSIENPVAHSPLKDLTDNLISENPSSAQLKSGSTTIQVDVVLGYSHLIKNQEGSSSAARALINLIKSTANTILRNSQTDVQFRFVWVGELNMTVPSSADRLYVHNQLTNSFQYEDGNEGYISTNPYHIISNKRYQMKADIVALVTGPMSSGQPGAGILPNSTTTNRLYSYIDCTYPVWGLGHEFGHNFGALHARHQYSESEITTNTNYGLYPYAYGFQSGGHFQTIMSYNCNSSGDCPRKHFFSNPDIRHSNIYAGDNLRDNAKAVRLRAPALSRLSEVLPGSDEPPQKKELPRITRQPVGGILASGPLTLEVVATDPNSPQLSLSYQWYRDDLALSGKRTNRLVLQPSSQSGTHKYYVKVSNTVGQTKSTEVTVSSLKSPRILRQPTGGFIHSNLGLTLEVKAVNPNPAPNNGALSYQWHKNGYPIAGEGAGKPRLWIKPSYNFEFQATYYVEVSYKGKVTRSNGVKVGFGIRLRNSKWEGLLDPETDPSLIEIGRIDRSLDLKRTPGEIEEEGIMRGPASEK